MVLHVKIGLQVQILRHVKNRSFRYFLYEVGKFHGYVKSEPIDRFWHVIPFFHSKLNFQKLLKVTVCWFSIKTGSSGSGFHKKPVYDRGCEYLILIFTNSESAGYGNSKMVWHMSNPRRHQNYSREYVWYFTISQRRCFPSLCLHLNSKVVLWTLRLEPFHNHNSN